MNSKFKWKKNRKYYRNDSNTRSLPKEDRPGQNTELGKTSNIKSKFTKIKEEKVHRKDKNPEEEYKISRI